MGDSAVPLAGSVFVLGRSSPGTGRKELRVFAFTPASVQSSISGNSWRAGGSGPLLSLPQPPEVRLRNQAETTSPSWTVAEPGSKSHLSPYLTVMTSESQGYILNWVWRLIPVIPELGRLVQEDFHEFKANETQIKQ